MFQLITHRLPQFFALICFTFASLSWAQPQEIRFNIGIGGYPPYTIIEQTEPETYSGIFIEVMNRITAVGGYEVSYHQIPRKRVNMMIEQGALDATPRAIEWTPEPERFLFTDTILEVRDVLFSPVDKPVQFENVSELLGMSLRTHVGYRYKSLDVYFDQNSIYRHDDETEEKMLSNLIASRGRFDAAIVDDLVGRWLIKQNGWKGQLVASESAIDTVGFRVMFNQDLADFVEFFNQELRKLKESSELKTIIDRYTFSLTRGS